MTPAKAQARSWKQGPHTADGTVKAIGESPLYLVRGLMLTGSLLELAIGRGKRRRALGVAVPQMPDDTATDDGGQIDPLGEAVAVFLIGQDISWQRQTTLDQHGHQAVLPQGTDQTIEGHRGSPSKVLLFFGNFVPLARRRDLVKERQGCRWRWGKCSNHLWNSDRY